MFIILCLFLIMQLFFSFFFINFSYTYILTSINRTTLFWEILITLLLPLVILLGISLGLVISNSFWALLYILMNFVILAVLLLNSVIRFITFFYVTSYIGSLMILFHFIIMIWINFNYFFYIPYVLNYYIILLLLCLLLCYYIYNKKKTKQFQMFIIPCLSLIMQLFFSFFFINFSYTYILTSINRTTLFWEILITLLLPLVILLGISLGLVINNSFWALLYILMSFVILVIVLLNNVIGFITFFYVTSYIGSLMILFYFIIMIWINFNYFFYIIFFSTIFLRTSTFIAPSNPLFFSSNNFKICPIRKDLLNIIIFSPYVLNYYILLLFFCLICLILYYVYNKKKLDNFNFWFLFFYDFYKNDVWLYDRDLFNWSINLQIMLYYTICFYFSKVLDNINIEEPSALNFFFIFHISSILFHLLITIKITRFIYKLFNFSNHLENIIFEMWKNKIENIYIDNKSFSVQELMNILKNYNEICFILVLLWTTPLYFSCAIVFVWFFYSLIIIFIILCYLFGAANVIAFFYLFVFLIYKCISLFFFKK